MKNSITITPHDSHLNFVSLCKSTAVLITRIFTHFEQFWQEWSGMYAVTQCTASLNTCLRLGYFLTSRFNVLCTARWCIFMLQFQCPLQRRSRPLQLLFRHNYVYRYIFPAYFMFFHKFLETFNRQLSLCRAVTLATPL
jgi:hypothetical protein